jgi:50S ribosomal protein L16 3-hydroxylase
MAAASSMILSQFDHQTFLTKYWQKKPLLIKNPGVEFDDPLSADELAGLACEESIESRLVTMTQQQSYQLRHGPFDEALFSTLPDSNWTLLVQAVDQFVAEVEALKSAFNFIPRWRIDDIMVSFACDGGGVGPHFDQYDVFLLQGSGSRNWRTGPQCTQDTPLKSDSDLRILQEFEANEHYILEPGDILYLPPGISHHGTSIGDSLCYSIGFRAPSWLEMLHGFTDALADTNHEDQRLHGPDSQARQASGEITREDLQHGIERLAELASNEDAYSRWFGTYATTARYPELTTPQDPQQTKNQIAQLLKRKTQDIDIYKNSSSRFAYQQLPGGIRLFVNGQHFDCENSQRDLVILLTESSWTQPLNVTAFLDAPENQSLLTRLLQQGSLTIEKDQ